MSEIKLKPSVTREERDGTKWVRLEDYASLQAAIKQERVDVVREFGRQLEQCLSLSGKSKKVMPHLVENFIEQLKEQGE